jgi:transketolase
LAKKKCIVTAEEHNILEVLESISRVLALNNPAPQEFVAVNDSFGESGTPAQLMKNTIKQSSNCCSRTSDQKKIIYL